MVAAIASWSQICKNPGWLASRRQHPRIYTREIFTLWSVTPAAIASGLKTLQNHRADVIAAHALAARIRLIRIVAGGEVAGILVYRLGL
jgi:hypothetical protein